MALKRGSEAGAAAVRQALADLGRPVLGRAGAPSPRGGERLADGGDDRRPGCRAEQRLDLGHPEQPVHGGQLTPAVGHGRFLGSRRPSVSGPSLSESDGVRRFVES